MTKRKLTSNEIENIIDFIKPNKNIPQKTAMSIVKSHKQRLRAQLQDIHIYPDIIPKLTEILTKDYYASQITPGESVGILCGQCIGEKNTQSTLNSFHHAGISEKSVVTGVPRFEELINATKNPKAKSCYIYFTQGTQSISELRGIIGSSLVELTLKSLIIEEKFEMNKSPERWYTPNLILYNKDLSEYKHCISLKLNTRVLYEYKITLQNIAEKIEGMYNDILCIFSPLHMGYLDIFVNTEHISLDNTHSSNNNIDEDEDDTASEINMSLTSNFHSFVTEENKEQVYLEEVVYPHLLDIKLCGISGISNIYYIEKDGEWMIETEGSNLKEILMLPFVDISRTYSNDIWEIYETFGIQATKQILINEFMDIMGGINYCHVKLLVDWMCFSGSIASISRYTMKKDECGPLSKSSFEETLSNLTSAALYSEVENTDGVSASVICGKRSKAGTGMFKLTIDMKIIKELSE